MSHVIYGSYQIIYSFEILFNHFQIPKTETEIKGMFEKAAPSINYSAALRKLEAQLDTPESLGQVTRKNVGEIKVII